MQLERERERDSLRPFSQQGLLGRICVQCLKPVEHSRQQLTDSLLILVPNQAPHGTLSISKQRRVPDPDHLELGALKQVVVFITNRQGSADRAPTKVRGELRPRKSALLNGQTMRPQPELHQRPKPSDRQRQLIVWVRKKLGWAAKPIMVGTELRCSIDGLMPW